MHTGHGTYVTVRRQVYVLFVAVDLVGNRVSLLLAAGKLESELPEILLTISPFLEELSWDYRHISSCPGFHWLQEVSILTLA